MIDRVDTFFIGLIFGILLVISLISHIPALAYSGNGTPEMPHQIYPAESLPWV